MATADDDDVNRGSFIMIKTRNTPVDRGLLMNDFISFSFSNIWNKECKHQKTGIIWIFEKKFSSQNENKFSEIKLEFRIETNKKINQFQWPKSSGKSELISND